MLKKYINININIKILILLVIIILLILLILYLREKRNKNNVNIETLKDNKKNKNLLFTSVGDNTNFYNYWLNDNRNYDILCVYYGNDENNYNKYTKLVDKIWKRKGSKFQNFHYIYINYRDLIDKYDRLFIVDDDIIMSTNDINNLFDISKKYDLWICQPSFTNDSKISHEITKYIPNNLLRYTNFVEVNTPVFSKYAITKFMEYYDPILIGWGIDYLYIWALGKNIKDKYAIIDIIKCTNPQDENKQNKNREHTNISNHDKEIEYWYKIKEKYNISDFVLENYKTILL
jgi:hypothetical protein